MLLRQIKLQTRPFHEKLEALHGLPESRSDYEAMLEWHFGYVQPLEVRLAEALAPGDPLRAGRAKAGWLEADLEHFGVTAAQRAELPRCELAPPGASRLQLLGACYVIEGSTLGARMMARHLTEVLELGLGGTRYFRGYGDGTAAQWAAFCAHLESAAGPGQEAEIVQAAVGTFERLIGWFASRRQVMS